MEKTVPSMETRSVLAMSYILEDYKKFGDINRECAQKYSIENSVEQLSSIISDVLGNEK